MCRMDRVRIGIVPDAALAPVRAGIGRRTCRACPLRDVRIPSLFRRAAPEARNACPMLSRDAGRISPFVRCPADERDGGGYGTSHAIAPLRAATAGLDRGSGVRAGGGRVAAGAGTVLVVDGVGRQPVGGHAHDRGDRDGARGAADVAVQRRHRGRGTADPLCAGRRAGHDPGGDPGAVHARFQPRPGHAGGRGVRRGGLRLQLLCNDTGVSVVHRGARLAYLRRAPDLRRRRGGVLLEAGEQGRLALTWFGRTRAGTITAAAGTKGSRRRFFLAPRACALRHQCSGVSPCSDLTACTSLSLPA
ncbi:hypothetical protein CBM2585_B10037 [Cupriavidus taiwanensis]|nr:hypothetical protein CBM2585_B10037 [Cupriavidus taiwanensis]